MIEIFLPRFNVTVSTSPATDEMYSSFCINGTCPPPGAKTLSKCVQRTIRGRNAVFAVSDSVSYTNESPTPSYKMAQIISQHAARLSEAKLEQLDIVMDDFLTDANGEVSSYASSNSLKDYGASFALLTVNDGAATFSNTGNVFGFSYSDGNLSQLTENHTDKNAPAHVLAHGDDGEQPPRLHSLTKYVGGLRCGETLHPYMSESFEINRNDVFLLCSAGMCDKLPQSRIAYILSLQTTDDKIVRRLISEALARGAEDDVTVMLIRNGAKPFKNKKHTTTFFRIAVIVAIVAVLTAFIASSLRSCSKKPAISEEGAVQQPVLTPSPTEFMTQESPPRTTVTENTAPAAQSLQ